jgi:hypothetical protein|tara:strand:+ start:425 stop:601 length:177 start_codon:yes stop_codon:yes gene_type:complete
MIGKKSGPPPKKGPNSNVPPVKFNEGGIGCPHRESSYKNLYPGNNNIQVKGFKFIGLK